MVDADPHGQDDPSSGVLRPFGWSYPQLLLAVFVVTAGVAVIVIGSTSTAAFSPHNTGWDGTDQLHELAADNGTAAVTTSTDRYESVEPSSTTAVVLAPQSSYHGTESEQVRTFVEDGGTLVVADDSGPNGNQLLSAVGATARFDTAMLRDRENNFRQSSFPVATNVSESSITQDVDQLTLNNGTVVEPRGARPVVASSPFGYLDPTGADELDDETTFQSYPVVTIESVGDGTVIAVSDPSLFINAMLEQPDNEAFASNLVANEETIIDSTHTAPRPPLVAGVSWLRETPLAATVVGIVMVGLVAIIGRPDRPPS